MIRGVPQPLRDGVNNMRALHLPQSRDPVRFFDNFYFRNEALREQQLART